MDDLRLGYYMSELTTQTQYAVIASGHLNDAFASGPAPDPEASTRAFAAVQALLGAGAVVSKLLWSPGAASARDRAVMLREALSVRGEDFPVLRDRAVRDSFEHVDERIDGYLAGRRPALDIADIEAGSLPPARVGGPMYLRRIDPDAGVVEVLGRAGAFDEVHLDSLVNEMGEVQARVNEWFAFALERARAEQET